MYRCEVCKAVSLPGEPRRVHIICRSVPKSLGSKQSRSEIAREVTICRECKAELDAGVLLADLIRARGVPEGKVAPRPSRIQPPPKVQGGRPLGNRVIAIRPHPEPTPPEEAPVPASDQKQRGAGPRKALRRSNQKTV